MVVLTRTLYSIVSKCFGDRKYEHITVVRAKCHGLDGWYAKGVLGISGVMLDGHQLTGGSEALHHCCQVF